ncbi:MAG: cupin domain-containing protein [Alphaproteobacteria bacterium]
MSTAETDSGTTRPWTSHYTVKATVIVAETADLRTLEITLGPGEAVPWHFHRQVEDIFYCLAGGIAVLTRGPEEDTRLRPGETCRVAARRPHRVNNTADTDSRFLIIQGPGKYDFVPVLQAAL